MIVNHSYTIAVSEIQWPIGCECHAFRVYKTCFGRGFAIATSEWILWVTSVAVADHDIKVQLRFVHFVESRNKWFGYGFSVPMLGILRVDPKNLMPLWIRYVKMTVDRAQHNVILIWIAEILVFEHRIDLSFGCYSSDQVAVSHVDTAVRSAGQTDRREKFVLSSETVALLSADRISGNSIAH